MRRHPGAPQTARRSTVVDPLDHAQRYIYLFLHRPAARRSPGRTSDVQMTRDANADEWIDRATFAPQRSRQDRYLQHRLRAEPARHGLPYLPGQRPEGDRPRRHRPRSPRTASRATGSRSARPTYQLKATGRWMVQRLPGHQARHDPASTAPDLLARWKGRAFQQSPDSTISLVGFEDEQVNWEANGALLGWRAGPVRAIREIWGADSGTNVTKTETYYRDADVYRYHVRVHPIPPDGLYTSWDYNPGVATRYYNLEAPNGVRDRRRQRRPGGTSRPGAGVPCVYEANPVKYLPCPGDPATSTSPTRPSTSRQRRRPRRSRQRLRSGLRLQAQRGDDALANAAVVPYYRDDACLDDGTGDDAGAAAVAGRGSTDTRVQAGLRRLLEGPRGAGDAEVRRPQSATRRPTRGRRRRGSGCRSGRDRPARHPLPVTQDSDNASHPRRRRDRRRAVALLGADASVRRTC